MLPHNKKLKTLSRNLRKDMTPHERHLWYDFLRTYTIRIYRQRVIGNFIADFYCPAAKLIIELDGGQHYSKDIMEYDKLRTDYFNSMGIKVIRFSNENCKNNFYETCQSIDNEIKKRL